MQDQFRQFVDAVRRRRPTALRNLVDRYDGLARNTVRRHLANKLRKRVESEDLLNDFWLSVFRRVDRLPNLADSHALRAYLRRVAFRQITKQNRRHLIAQCRRLDLEAPVADVDQVDRRHAAEESVIAETIRRELVEYLRSCTSEKEWRILQMKMIGLSNREIGRSLGVDEGSIRRTLRRIGRIASQHGADSSDAHFNNEGD